jgi:hypothetical protein
MIIEPTDWLLVLEEAGSRLLYRLPEIIGFILGMAVALWNWRSARRASLLALAGSGLLLIGVVGLDVVVVTVWRRRELFGYAIQDLRSAVEIARVTASCLCAAGFVLVLLAAFIKRVRTTTESWETDG